MNAFQDAIKQNALTPKQIKEKKKQPIAIMKITHLKTANDCRDILKHLNIKSKINGNYNQLYIHKKGKKLYATSYECVKGNYKVVRYDEFKVKVLIDIFRE